MLLGVVLRLTQHEFLENPVFGVVQDDENNRRLLIGQRSKALEASRALNRLPRRIGLAPCHAPTRHQSKLACPAPPRLLIFGGRWL
jgi:hypothetical protein